MSDYRAMVYHRTLPPRLVTSEAEYRQALASDWADSPAVFTDAASDGERLMASARTRETHEDMDRDDRMRRGRVVGRRRPVVPHI